MANSYVDCDRDSAFGDDDDDDDDFRTTDPMLSTHPVTGTKRGACEPGDDAQKLTLTTGPGTEHLGSQLCCKRCPDVCPDAYDMRPAKRKALGHKVGEYHPVSDLDGHLESECPFPDDCFEKFCEGCNVEPSCPPDCSMPCPADDCPRVDTCFDPQCTQEKDHCTDDCVDPDCTKVSCPEQSCFCQKCNAQPCPLGDPDNECHLAHSAPTPVGTVYCYDSAPCHFQQGLHGHDNGLSSFETYPCFSQAHGYGSVAGDLTTVASSAPTPALSHSNYTSLESAFTMEPSPPPDQAAHPPHCYLSVFGDHCHIDNSCCHGSERRCGDAPSASQQQLDNWNSSIALGNGLANNFKTFGFNSSLSTTPISADRNSIHSDSFNLDNSMMGFDDFPFHNMWTLPDSEFAQTFQPTGAFGGANKLDFLASAIQNDLLRPDTTTSVESGPILGPGSSDAQTCTCKWCVSWKLFDVQRQ